VAVELLLVEEALAAEMARRAFRSGRLSRALGTGGRCGRCGGDVRVLLQQHQGLDRVDLGLGRDDCEGRGGRVARDRAVIVCACEGRAVIV
jgi:bacterioferritin-associated ferredoxin